MLLKIGGRKWLISKMSAFPPRFYSYAEVAEMFGKSPRTIRWWVTTNRIRAIRIGGSRSIPKAEILRLATGGEG
jgi:excisionase family DNA binding protein